MSVLLAWVSACEEGGGTPPAETSAGETTGSSDSGGGVDTAGLDEVEAACEADCEALLSTECAPVNQDVLTCKLQCASITVQLGDFCLSEYTSVVQSCADRVYDSVYDYPTPRSTCAAESATDTECMADLGCKRFCDEAIDAGCGGASFEACFDACQAETTPSTRSSKAP